MVADARILWNSWHDLPSEIVLYGDNVKAGDERHTRYASRHSSYGNLAQE